MTKNGFVFVPGMEKNYYNVYVYARLNCEQSQGMASRLLGSSFKKKSRLV